MKHADYPLRGADGHAATEQPVYHHRHLVDGPKLRQQLIRAGLLVPNPKPGHLYMPPWTSAAPCLRMGD